MEPEPAGEDHRALAGYRPHPDNEGVDIRPLLAGAGFPQEGDALTVLAMICYISAAVSR